MEMKCTHEVPKVSIICAWYNRAEYIKATLDSLLSQDFDSFEVLVTNDGSTDVRVREILDGYRDDRLRVFHQENKGFTRTISDLVGRARAPLIAIQGAGDISYTERIKKQWEYLEKNPDVGVVGTGHVLVVAGNKGGAYHSPVTSIDKKLLLKMVPFTHGTMMYRRRVYTEAGGYDTRFRYCSDWDLYFRFIDITKIKGIDQALYEKRIFHDGFTFSPSHRFKQRSYRALAIYRGGDRERRINISMNDINNLDAEKIKYFLPSAKYFFSALKRRDYRNTKGWMMLMLRQVNPLKLFYR